MKTKTDEATVEMQATVAEEAKKPTIEAGKAYTITAATRAEAIAKLKALQEQAEAQGLRNSTGGFIQFVKADCLAVGTFKAVITFNK